MQRTTGANYFKAIYKENKKQVDVFVTLANSGSATLAQLKAAYAKGRPLYEQIEVLAPAFPDEDKAIDARPDGYELGESLFVYKSSWHVKRNRNIITEDCKDCHKNSLVWLHVIHMH
jgi:iron uptake system EfeUOB component EfeO/EfeM